MKNWCEKKELVRAAVFNTVHWERMICLYFLESSLFKCLVCCKWSVNTPKNGSFYSHLWSCLRAMFRIFIGQLQITQ